MRLLFYWEGVTDLKKTLTLINPILINNETVSEVTYDANEITGALFVEAEATRKAAAGVRNVGIAPTFEFDFGLHLYLGFAAILAVNPSYDFNDLGRIKGGDVVQIMEIGRNFIMRPEKLALSSSGKQSETTADSTTPA